MGERERGMTGCSIRAIWILNLQDTVVFSRRFPVVEKRWRLACQRENESSGSHEDGGRVEPLLPTDPELASAFSERKRREGSARGYGIRLSHSTPDSDSWSDDPITRHIIMLHINREEGEEYKLWPLVLHIKGVFYILVLPLVEPQQYKLYMRICRRSDCGNASGGVDGLSSLLLNLPCITGACVVAHTLGDIITGDLADPEVVSSSSASVGGLLDSLTGSIGMAGISARAKPALAPVVALTTSGASLVGAVLSDTPRTISRPIDKEVLRTFISASMPFGTPLDLNFANIASIKANGFSSADPPLADLKQPAWKPYLYKGKQRILFAIHEVVNAAMYDRDEISDAISISGQINCRAELEGLPDVSVPLTGLKSANVEVLSFHHCAQVSEHGLDKQAFMFSPPLGNFVLIRYIASCSLDPPVKGFYQLSMVSEDEGAFLFKLRLMEGYKAPFSMDFCTVTMPFPRRRVASFDGNPSIGTVAMTEHSLEWKIITSGRGITGKSIEATFSGTIKFFPRNLSKGSVLNRSITGRIVEEDSDVEQHAPNSMANVEEYLMEAMSKDLQAAELEEPLCWQAYNYAKVSFKILAGTLSRLSIDPKSVGSPSPRIEAADRLLDPVSRTEAADRSARSRLPASKPQTQLSRLLACFLSLNRTPRLFLDTSPRLPFSLDRRTPLDQLSFETLHLFYRLNDDSSSSL
ncbi:AP-5 complex subunit mu [Phalaenopsis equestris]|uniref:AP-5 complex subunit mu n=1 Tax=Phalaenopsis equestris TaxID=78828 RepID=UPI0009E1B647|nr:AP-5 complex subunit mu [Phalaenopsis equestris]